MACSNLHFHTVPALPVWSVEYREAVTCHFLDWVIKDSGFSGFNAGFILSLSFSLFTYWGSQWLYCQLSFGEAHMARNSSPQSNSQQGEARCHVMKTFRQPMERPTKWKTKSPANNQWGLEAHQQLHEGAWKWIVSQSRLRMRQQPWLAAYTKKGDSWAGISQLSCSQISAHRNCEIKYLLF